MRSFVCEAVNDRTGEQCRKQARYRLQVGNRSYDAQSVCAIHLAPVCRTFIMAEGRDVAVSVTLLQPVLPPSQGPTVQETLASVKRRYGPALDALKDL